MDRLPPTQLSWLSSQWNRLRARWRRSEIKSEPKVSRLQRRLRSMGRNRHLANALRYRRTHLSRLSQRLHIVQTQRRRWRRKVIAVTFGLGLVGVTWTALFVSERITLGGIPYRIVQKFLNDEAAKTAYFAGDRQALHDRLNTLGVEADIKDYYRDRFDSESELDLYIHQMMFDQTGYIGEAYTVDSYGQLNSRYGSPTRYGSPNQNFRND